MLCTLPSNNGGSFDSYKLNKQEIQTNTDRKNRLIQIKTFNGAVGYKLFVDWFIVHIEFDINFYIFLIIKWVQIFWTDSLSRICFVVIFCLSYVIF